MKHNKKMSVFILIVAMMALLVLSYAEADMATNSVNMLFTIDDSTYIVNDQVAAMDPSPRIVESRTLLPIRYVATPLGAAVSWDGVEQKVTIELAGKTIEMWIGQAIALVDGQTVFIDPSNANVKPIIIDNRTMLPIRFVSENLGCAVVWNEQTRQVQIVSSGATVQADVNSLEVRYGKQLDYNLGILKDKMTLADRNVFLKLIETIDKEVKVRAEKNQFDFTAVERSAREEFNERLDDLTNLYYPEPELNKPYHFINYGTKEQILESLNDVMVKTDFDSFLASLDNYLDDSTHINYLQVLSFFEPYDQLDGALIITLLDRFKSEQIKAFYQIDDQFNLVSQPIVDGGHTIATGKIEDDAEKLIWQAVKSVISPEHLQYFGNLLISSDEAGYNIASAVKVLGGDDSKERWLLQVDDADISNDLVISLLYIYGNYLTLNDQQVKNENGFSVDRYCEPGLIANQDALLTDFYLRFWKDYVNVDTFQTSYQFYLRNQSDFVSVYAFSSASIDISESFSYFVLREKPEDDSIAEQKIRFFYDYPQLVELRQTIRQSLADANLLTDASLSTFMGTINQPTVLTDSDDIKVTFQEAYKSYEYDGIVVRLAVENKLNKSAKFGFYHVDINDKSIVPIQIEKDVAAGQTAIVTCELISNTDLRTAGINTLKQLSLGCYYYPEGEQRHLLDVVEFSSDENLND